MNITININIVDKKHFQVKIMGYELKNFLNNTKYPIYIEAFNSFWKVTPDNFTDNYIYTVFCNMVEKELVLIA